MIKKNPIESFSVHSDDQPEKLAAANLAILAHLRQRNVKSGASNVEVLSHWFALRLALAAQMCWSKSLVWNSKLTALIEGRREWVCKY